MFWTNNSYCYCVKTSQLGVRTSCIVVSGWVLGGNSGFVSALDFCMFNTIYYTWSSLYDPLRDIILWYRPWFVPVPQMSSHYWCCYLMLDLLHFVDVANHTYQTHTKGLYIPCKLFGYSVYTSTVFNIVYTKKGKVD